MSSIQSVGPTASQPVATCGRTTDLVALAVKIGVGGDLASECMALFAEDNACRLQTSYRTVQIQQREVREARQKRRALQQAIRQARRKSGFFSRLGSVLGKLAAAVGAALSVLGGPVAVAGLAGAVATGATRVAGAAYDKRAARAMGEKLQVEMQKDAAAGVLEEEMQAMEQAVALERKMGERIRALLESEQHGRLALG